MPPIICQRRATNSRLVLLLDLPTAAAAAVAADETDKIKMPCDFEVRRLINGCLERLVGAGHRHCGSYLFI